MSELIECLDGLRAEDIVRRIAKTANGVPFYINTMGLSRYCTQFQTVLDAYTGTIPDAIQLDAQNTLACGLYEDGVWNKLDAFWVLANGDSPNCLLNWINPALYTLAPVNLPLFTPWEGVTGNGTNAYINHNWISSVDGVNYVQNSASIGCYIRNNIARNDKELGATQASTIGNILLGVRRNDNFLIGRLNHGGDDFKANTDSRGLWIMNRTGAPNVSYYRNKVLFHTGIQASNGVINFALYSLAYNFQGAAAGFSTKQLSMVFAGGGLIQADIDSITDRFETYMDFLGKGVIP